MNTLSDPYFVAAVRGREMPSGTLLVLPAAEGPWEEWASCGQQRGEAGDLLYKSKWYRKVRSGTVSQLGGEEDGL